ncbi:hypothetical protein CVT24_007559 [Panaeolus cyanescens]|uniref:Uncharacterized protein n=1 Tax=Panaeolus cyanescens TaxID=181874 RepID=A0A409VR37_9AGAR|nr:hypothetical protein CVT24_007559 [Panaeolus cyanescens]
MATIFTRRLLNTLRKPSLQNFARPSRAIHLSPVVQKKKSKAVVEDLFAEDAFVEEELFKDPTAATSEGSSSTANAEAEAAKAARARRKLSDEKRKEIFEHQLAFLAPRVGRSPSEKTPKFKKGTLLQLLQFATTPEQIQQIVDVLPKYAEGGAELPCQFAQAFARRCEEVKAQSIALEVFGNFAKYHVSLNLPAARQLLHSVYTTHPLKDTLLAASYLPVYGLGEVTDDMTSAAFVAFACLKEKTPESIKVARQLLPSITEAIKNEDVDLTSASTPEERRWKKWTAWALAKTDVADRANGGTGITLGGKQVGDLKKTILKIPVVRPTPAEEVQAQA